MTNEEWAAIERPYRKAIMDHTTRKRAPGAGRKPVSGEGTQRVTVTLRPSDLAYLRRIDPNLSAAIRTLIDEQKRRQTR